MKDFFVHDSSIVETKDIGPNSRIWAFVHIGKGVKIGRNANICDHCFIESNVEVGNDVTIKCGVYLWDGMKIEDGVFIGPGATFTDDKYPRSKNKDYKKENIILGKGCTIGANSTILAGVKIGEYSMIGAGAVVTKDIPSFSIAYGNPAEVKGYVCICAKKMNFTKDEYKCSCGRSYIKVGDKISLI